MSQRRKNGREKGKERDIHDTFVVIVELDIKDINSWKKKDMMVVLKEVSKN